VSSSVVATRRKPTTSTSRDNGAMIEGWAVYGQRMMLENGWGNYSPELKLVDDKLKLRELANVLIDYDIQCLNKPKS
jgi:hypothetical protein